MKKSLFVGVLFTVMILAFTSCSDSNPIVGKWEQKIEEGGVDMEIYYNFKNSGDMTLSIEMESKSPKMNIEGEGISSYKFSGDTLEFILTEKNFKFTKFEVEGLDPSLTTMAKNQMLKMLMDVDNRYTDVKIEDGILTARVGDQTVTFKKK